jgi:predicted 3-demethylubiquinone-9 3-methyltransferase (glyoxalase superfamily)
MADRITPLLMFAGKAEAAMTFYVSLFPGAEVTALERYGDSGAAGTVKRAHFVLAGQELICIDSPVKHGFSFTPSISLFVSCDSEAEIETLFAGLSDGGKVLMPLMAYPFSRKFAWVSDKFGLSWQLNLPTEN